MCGHFRIFFQFNQASDLKKELSRYSGILNAKISNFGKKYSIPISAEFQNAFRLIKGVLSYHQALAINSAILELDAVILNFAPA